MRILTIVSACALATSALAADLDCNPVRVIVPFPPGGASDVGARIFSDQIGKNLGKTFVIENKVGASGNLAAEYVIGSAKNGCTLLVHANTLATSPLSFSKLSFDPLKDLTVVGAIGITPTVLVTANKSIADLKDLQTWARTKPEGLSYGSSGYGTLAHLAIEEIAYRTQAKFLHVPYRGGAQATTDMISGRLDFGSFALGTIMPFLKQNQIKALAVVQPKPSMLVDDTRTTADQGIPDLDARLAFMFFAPKGTPESVVNLLNSEISQAGPKPEVAAKLSQIGYEPLVISPAMGVTIMQKAADQWAPVIKRLGIKIE